MIHIFIWALYIWWVNSATDLYNYNC